jgi:O-methyltransferase involved in polyketide biosynthesis
VEKRRIDELPPVARTLIIPLAARARETTRPDALLHDPKAVELMDHFNVDLSRLPEQDDMEQAAIMLRARHFDRIACDFLQRHTDGMIVELGCGLDTRFDRLDEGNLVWIGLDIPEVIELRCDLIPATPRCSLIAASVVDPGWLEVVQEHERPVIFLAEGIFPYIDAVDVHSIILTLCSQFPGAELVFDALSPFSIWVHQRRHHQLTEMNIHLGWGLRSAKEFTAWDDRIHVLSEWHYFEDKEPRIGWYNLARFIRILAHMNWVLHCRLGD